MAPFFVLVIGTVLLRVVGYLGVGRLSSWREAGTIALAIMFVFTGVTHFTAAKYDYAAMLPGPVPDGLWIVYLTGALEIAGAVGLLVPRTRKLAGICLVAYLIAVFPGNVYAAVNDVPFRGEPPTPLWLRTPIQLFFIGAVWWTSIRDRPQEAGSRRAEGTAAVGREHAPRGGVTS